MAHAHVRQREGGVLTTGYIPTPRSGVTIGAGIDLGQQSLATLRSKGVAESIIRKLRPYLGLETKEAVDRAGLNASNLHLTQREAEDLSNAFFKEVDKVTEPYGRKMSQKGRDVLASLRHWAGRLGNSVEDKKLARTVTVGNTEVVKNWVWDAIKNQNATDADLRRALEMTIATYNVGEARYNRLRKEIAHLN